MDLFQLFAILFFLLLGIAFWWWLSPKKKEGTTEAFQEAWRLILSDYVRFYKGLQATDKTRFEENILHFWADVRISGVGTEVDDTDRLLVGASAVIPLFGFPGWHYRKVSEVILYEGSFNHNFETQQGEERNIQGMVGGANMTSTMILSKPALHQGFKNNSRHNVGIHEFVHMLDRADGATDGMPEALLQEPFLIPWLQMMLEEIKDIKDGESDINPYGSTNEAEFLSVVSEYFFQQPKLLEKRHPELFNMLERVFKQDLA